MNRRKSGLGRGLDALIPGSSHPLITEGVEQLAADRIIPNPRQPRSHFDPEELDELAISIREHGILQPLIVTSGPENGQYTLIAGERRLQAARKAGLQRVPAIVRDASDQQLIELALIENVQRADLNPLEAAEAYRQLSEDFGLTHEEVADRVGKSRTSITNTLRLLKLPASVQQAIVDQQISEGHARALLSLPSHQAQVAVLQIIMVKDLSVRQTEELVRKYGGQKPESTPKPAPAPELRAIEAKLREYLGTRVKLNKGRKGGSITIHYYSNEELDALLSLILQEHA